MMARNLFNIVAGIAALLLAPNASAAPMQFNGHFYEVVLAQDAIANPVISWESAETAVSSMTFMGVPGHLATITSLAENNFIEGLLTSSAYSVGINCCGGTFRIGPWIGLRKVGGVFEWVTGEPFVFEDWIGLEPNNTGGVEDYVAFLDWTDTNLTPGAEGHGIGWSDCDNVCFSGSPRVRAFIVEYNIPEPGTVAILGLGLIGLGLARRRRTA